MKKLLFISIVALGLSSCSEPKNLYSWHDYEDVTYEYSKNPTEKLKTKVLKEYQRLTEKQKGIRKIVPPGLLAEYGYMLYMNGKPEEGLKLLNDEIKLYPESEKYISRIIKQLEK